MTLSWIYPETHLPSSLEINAVSQEYALPMWIYVGWPNKVFWISFLEEALFGNKHCVLFYLLVVLCLCVAAFLGFRPSASCLLSVLVTVLSDMTSYLTETTHRGLFWLVIRGYRPWWLGRYSTWWVLTVLGAIITCWQIRKQCLMDLQLDPKSSSLPTCTPHHPTRYHTSPEIMLLALGPSVHAHEPVKIFHIQTLTQPPSKHSTTELLPPLQTFDVQNYNWCHCWLAFTPW